MGTPSKYMILALKGLTWLCVCVCAYDYISEGMHVHQCPYTMLCVGSKVDNLIWLLFLLGYLYLSDMWFGVAP